MTVHKVTDANFKDEVLGSDALVAVDFFATWCGPCRQMAPIFEELSEELSAVKFVKLDVDEAPGAASTYRVTGIPTLAFFKNGELVHTSVGAKPKAALTKEFETAAQK